MKTNENKLKGIFLALLLCVMLTPMSFAEKVKLTLAVNPLNTQEKYILIDTENPELSFELTKALSAREDLQLFLQSRTFEADRAALDANTFNFPMVLGRNEFINKDNAAQDCLIGAGACLAGIMFVLVTGSSEEPAPSGFNAFVNDTYVTGGSALFVTALWTAGCVFGVKGIIELFSRRKSDKKTSSIQDQDHQYLTTQELIQEGRLTKKSEWVVEVDANQPINKDLISYFVHLINV